MATVRWNTCAMQKEVAQMECTISRLRNRLRGLDDMLENPKLSGQRRRDVKAAISQVEELLDENNELLKTVHKTREKQMMYLAVFIFLSFLLFGIYCMFLKKI